MKKKSVNYHIYCVILVKIFKMKKVLFLFLSVSVFSAFSFAQSGSLQQAPTAAESAKETKAKMLELETNTVKPAKRSKADYKKMGLSETKIKQLKELDATASETENNKTFSNSERVVILDAIEMERSVILDGAKSAPARVDGKKGQ